MTINSHHNSYYSDPANSMTISVIIPVRNGGENFRRCLATLYQADPVAFEIIVVADGDTDAGELAKTFGAKVEQLENSQGPAKARNLGANLAQGEILFFLDADVGIKPYTIAQVKTIFSENPQLAATIGSYDDVPGANNFLSQYKNLLHHYVHQMASKDASTFWGACGAIRRDILMAVGGFDESYQRPCVEDIELGYRLKQAGYQIRLSKSLQVKHLKRWDVNSLIKADFFDRALPWMRLILRDRAPINDLNLKWSSRVSVLIVYGILISFMASLWFSWQWLILTACLVIALLAINASVYQFFWQRRGWLFTLKAMPWHWLYYFYSGLALLVTVVAHIFPISHRK